MMHARKVKKSSVKDGKDFMTMHAEIATPLKASR